MSRVCDITDGFSRKFEHREKNTKRWWKRRLHVELVSGIREHIGVEAGRWWVMILPSLVFNGHRGEWVIENTRNVNQFKRFWQQPIVFSFLSIEDTKNTQPNIINGKQECNSLLLSWISQLNTPKSRALMVKKIAQKMKDDYVLNGRWEMLVLTQSIEEPIILLENWWFTHTFIIHTLRSFS